MMGIGDQRVACPTARIQPIHVPGQSELGLQQIQGIEPDFGRVTIGPDQAPFAIHAAVGNNTRLHSEDAEKKLNPIHLI